ncbi:hypothetical protein NLJ89_g12314 [Agrocybe chaxingu]|uniref:Uncharacterized protein n=1 Tax=Agrocybe chaxingu TaxID=84603 RepID=A0A9W8MM96_9AGAR|nr:hypothetical protein NLJ89_g12314 [Agrocybe chaxingu]
MLYPPLYHHQASTATIECLYPSDLSSSNSSSSSAAFHDSFERQALITRCRRIPSPAPLEAAIRSTGKPLLVDTLSGSNAQQKPHSDSLLRADPSTFDGSSQLSSSSHEPESRSPFPSTPFNFAFPPYEGIFDLPGAASASNVQYSPTANPNYHHRNSA